MINGAFTVIQYYEQYPFVKRNDNGLWELPGGGFEIDETNPRKIGSREIKEEIDFDILPENLFPCAILGQKLKKEISAQYGGIQYGFLFLHWIKLSSLPPHSLSEEHTDYRLFTKEEIIEEWRSFSSGPLWLFFTFLSFEETGEMQYGKLFDRRMWKGIEYYDPL